MKFDIALVVADFLFNTRRYHKAIHFYKEARNLLSKSEVDNLNSLRMALQLAQAYINIKEFQEAQANYQQVLKISKEIGDRAAEATAYRGLVRAYGCTGQHIQEIFYQRKLLEIVKESGDKREEREIYINIACAYSALGKQDKYIEFENEALRICIEIGDKNGEGIVLRDLGSKHKLLGQYHKALRYLEKSLEILKDIGDYREEATSYQGLGNVYQEMGDFKKALYIHFKSLEMMTKHGGLADVGVCYNNIGTSYHALSQYSEALEYFETTLEIMRKCGKIEHEGRAHHGLGLCYLALGQHQKAIEHQMKAVQILKETGDRFGEGRSSVMLGNIYNEIGHYKESIESYKMALKISKETGDRKVESNAYRGLGDIHGGLEPRSDQGEKYLKKAHDIAKQTGDKKELAFSYIGLGAACSMRGRYMESLENLNLGIDIMREIGDKYGEVTGMTLLASVNMALGKLKEAMQLQKKALNLMRKTGEAGREYDILLSLALGTYNRQDGDLTKAREYLLESITCIERDRRELQDEHKLSLDNKTFRNYSILCTLLITQGNISEALCTAERGRARALVDLLSKRYGIHERSNSNEICVDEIRKLSIQNQSTIIFMAVYKDTHLWIMEEENIRYRLSKLEPAEESIADLLHLSRKQLLHDVRVTVACEDRSLSAYYRVPSSSDKGKKGQQRLVEEEEEKTKKKESSLYLLYKKLIAPVADLVQRQDIVIVPEGDMFMVPFPALQDANGKFMSETLSIRLIPSLKSLKLIQSSPNDFHSTTGALIVGDPAVHPTTRLQPLPEARKEAQEIAELLGTTAIVGNQATKEAILRKMQGVSLIHFAAHGDAERGEIALSPSCSSKRIPRKKDFMLTMEDIAKVGLRAKLVVLSCCHSGRGEIMKSEGVVGISRAFLASGARCVLVSLWLLDDKSTKEFMIRFYGHLVRDKLSASKALHQSMKWMRESKKYSVCDWAPFVLIGDDVTLDL